MEEFKDLKRSKWRKVYDDTVSKILICSFEGRNITDSITGLRVSIRDIERNSKDTIFLILNNKLVIMKKVVEKNIDYLLHTHFSDLGIVDKGEYLSNVFAVLIETSFGAA